MKIVQKVYIETSCHATEEEDKVKQAMLNLLPDDYRESFREKIYTDLLHGFYGNPILLLKLPVDTPEVAQKCFKHILTGMGESEFEYILSTIDIRYDGKGNVYLRLNKQSAYLEKIILDEESDDIVKLKVTLYPHIRREEDIVQSLKRLHSK
ncbi:MAG: hypothetical protein DRJ51_01705 [Thermoprotei archaeon]|nr:MAG: hypothetical protein DRJ51_01705 [Thermoprotei archaeon]